MFIFILSFVFAEDISSNSTFSPEQEDLNVSGTFKIDYTNTIKFVVTETEVKTLDLEGHETHTKSFIAVYTPTVLKILRLVDLVQPTHEAPTATATATPGFKYVFFKPGICVGATFALLFLICACYTSLCRRPHSAVLAANAAKKGKKQKQQKKQKKAIGRRNSISDDSVDSFSGAQVHREEGQNSDDNQRPNTTRINTNTRQTRTRSSSTRAHTINDNREFL